MKNPLALMIAALAAVAVPLAVPAQAHDHWAVIPAEIGVPPVVGDAGWLPYRCNDGPVYNFYHGAYYREPPALYLDYAYRPYYRYTAYRVIPRTYLCARR
jgi:hypothetical protein